MSGRIPETFIDELLTRTDIVDVIERRVELKRAGSEFQARCPLHDEKTPSFTVSPAKQFYHCFGCGAHGSAIGFLMQYEGLEFPDAIEELARHAGLEVPREGGGAPVKPRHELYAVLERAASFFQQQLREHPPAIEYLKSRGLSGEICRDFGVGFAPDSWDALMKHIGTGEKEMKLMHRAGLLSEGKNKAYDKFRNRIMFPIHDRSGRVIAFGGRAMGEDGPKYLNSPETELFHKGRELYGLYLARQRVGRLETVIVVEGYTDVVALAQFGLRNTVATLGTATTPQHAEILFRAADTVVYCFDGDAAGRKAAWRALEAALPKLREGLQARFLFLPDGEDPDSLVRKQGKEAFEALLEQAQPLSDFLFEHFIAQVDMDSIDGRAKLVQLTLPLLRTLPEGVFRDMMMERLETLARHRIGAQGEAPSGQAQPRARTPRPRGGQARTPLRLAMAFLIQNPALVELLKGLDELDGAEIQGIDIFMQLVDFCRKSPNMTTAQVMEHLRTHPAREHLGKLAAWDLPGDADRQALEFCDSVDTVKLQWLDIQISRIGSPSRSPDEYRRLQQRRQELKSSLQGQITDGVNP
ncbi:MAG: DNA primase, partial [Xanthomonadales bacterium]|nr:DNA primase [Xanthomonadales bacterium]